MRKTGIWMDKKKAIIVSFENDLEKIHEINSNIEDFHVKGGSGSRFKGGPQDVVQDSRYLELEKNQYRLYFKNIIPYIKSAEEVVIFGPAEAGMKFMNELSKNHKRIHEKVLSLEKADNMTTNQLKAWVKGYFEKHANTKV